MLAVVVATGLNRAGARRTAPPLVMVPRTGTDNMPAVNVPLSPLATPTASTQDYGNMSVPSVWRNNRTQAAAKVDALASGGMDDIEIPAFLRRQAD